MIKIVEKDFSNIVKKSLEDDRAIKIGEIDDVTMYYDKYMEENQFIVGFKGELGKINFIVGNSKDIKFFRKALESYKNYNYEKY